MSLFANHTPKQVTVFSLIGLVIGLLSYCTLLTATTALIFPLLLCFLYLKGGFVPVLSGILGYAMSFTLLTGPAGALLLSLMMVLPALLTIITAAKGLPYFTQLKISVFSYAGSIALLLAGAGAMAGGNLVDIVIESGYAFMLELPAEVQSSILTRFYSDLMEVNATGVPLLTEAVRLQYWKDFFLTLRDSLQLQLLPMLLKSGLTTAFLSSYLTARALRLRNEIPETAFVPLSQWQLSGQMTVGILLTTLASYLLNLFGLSNGAAVFLTMFTVMECVFAVQGAAAWSRMLCAAKAGFPRKVITVGIMAMIASTFLSAIGICSAAFGRKGLLMNMKKRNQQK